MTVTAADAPTAPALDLGLTVEEPAWHAAIPDLEARTRAAVTAAINGARGDGDAGPATAAAYELGVVFADDGRVAGLNAAYRGQDGPTNVLAFEGGTPPPDGAPWQLGDVIIAFGRTQGEAQAAGLTVADHALHLVVHGVLHLFGYDHQTDAEAGRMEALEVRVLSGLGIADPYGGGTRA